MAYLSPIVAPTANFWLAFSRNHLRRRAIECFWIWTNMENCKVRIEEGAIEAEKRGIYKLSTFVKKDGDKLEVDENRISDITRRIIGG